MSNKCNRGLLRWAVWWLGWLLCATGGFQSAPSAGAALAEIDSPADGTTFTSGSVTFNWHSDAAVSQFVLWVGSASGSYDIFAGVIAGRAKTVNLPVDGRKIYVTLWAWSGGTWQAADAHTYTAATPVKAQMVSPTNGTTFTSASTTFTWDAGVGVTQYALWVGSSPSSYDIYAGIESGLSRTLTLPTDGRTLHVALWSWINNNWQSNTYTYTAYSAPIAQMIRPVAGSTLTGDRVTFEWASVSGATWYALWVGSSASSYDLYAALETGPTRTVKVPADGRTLHITLWTYINGSWGSWRANAYTYTAYTAGSSEKAVMQSPAGGTTLVGDRVSFEWLSGVGATQYALWVGSSSSSYDLYAGIETDLSQIVKVPTDGRTLHVTLWSWINNAWQSNAYTYAAHTAAGTEKAQMQSPTPGATLTSGAVKFSWSSGVGATQYALWAGSSPSGYDLYAGLETGLSRALTLPTDGRTLYVTLWSWLNGSWQSNAYTYTAYGVSGPISSLNLLKKISIPNAARPEIIATASRVFVVYLEPSISGNSFKVKIYDRDLTNEISSKTLVTAVAPYGNPTDIRVVSDGTYLYAFYETAGASLSYLWGAKYTLNDNFEGVAYQGPIAQSTMFKVAKPGDEKLDDPAPMLAGANLYAMTRYKTTLAKEGDTIYKLYKFDKDLNKQSDSILDLSDFADGEARQSSIIYDNGHYYIAMQTSTDGVIDETVEWTAPSDLLMVKLDSNWNVEESRTIAQEEGYTEGYVTGLKSDERYFYITYNQVILGKEFSSMIKIYDRNWNAVLTEKYKTASGGAASGGLRPSIEVTADRIYAGNGEGGTQNAEIYIFEKK